MRSEKEVTASVKMVENVNQKKRKILWLRKEEKFSKKEAKCSRKNLLAEKKEFMSEKCGKF